MMNRFSQLQFIFRNRIPNVIVLLILFNNLWAQNTAAPLTIQQDSAYTIISKGDTVFIASVNEKIECGKISPRGYPKQLPDDYLYEERFDGLKHVVIFDHIVTRKMLNVFIPTLNNPDADLCGVKIIVTNPHTGQVAVFYDVFNWIDRSGKQIFNMNKELHALWGFSGTKEKLPVKLYHVPTGTDYSFNHTEMTLIFKGL